MTTQSTKIGRETFFVQNDPRNPGEELFCTFNSLQPAKKWPFVNLEVLADTEKSKGGMHGWGRYTIMFGDIGCMYFLVDEQGNIRWTWDSY